MWYMYNNYSKIQKKLYTQRKQEEGVTENLNSECNLDFFGLKQKGLCIYVASLFVLENEDRTRVNSSKYLTCEWNKWSRI